MDGRDGLRQAEIGNIDNQNGLHRTAKPIPAICNWLHRLEMPAPGGRRYFNS